MDRTRLNRLGDELAKARKKRDEWEGKVKELERKYREAENTCIHDMVHAANLTPEQLSELIRKVSVSLPHTAETMEGDPGIDTTASEETDTKPEAAALEKAEPEANPYTSWPKTWPRFSERRTNEKK